jgi:hypothetical protein
VELRIMYTLRSMHLNLLCICVDSICHFPAGSVTHHRPRPRAPMARQQRQGSVKAASGKKTLRTHTHTYTHTQRPLCLSSVRLLHSDSTPR